MKNSKKVTIESLARMVSQGFEATSRKINDLDGKIDFLHEEVKDLRREIRSAVRRVARIEEALAI